MGLPTSELERLAQEDAAENEWLEDAEMRGKAPTAVDGQGRESGPEDWKKQRGEDGC